MADKYYVISTNTFNSREGRSNIHATETQYLSRSAIFTYKSLHFCFLMKSVYIYYNNNNKNITIMPIIIISIIILFLRTSLLLYYVLKWQNTYKLRKESQPSSTLVILTSQRWGLFDLLGLQLTEKSVETCNMRFSHAVVTSYTVRIFHHFRTRTHRLAQVYLGDPHRTSHCQYTRSNGLVHNRPAGIYLSACPWVCLSVCPPTRLSFCTSVCLSVCCPRTNLFVSIHHCITTIRYVSTGTVSGECRGVRRTAGSGNRRQATRTGVGGHHWRRLRSTRDRGHSTDHTAQRRIHPQTDQQGERWWFVHVWIRSVGRQLQSGDPWRGGQR